MKRLLLALLAIALASAALAQPQVAVLDAIVPQNMDPSIIIPATEKIIERLVVSGRFMVLDRANIESVLKEREFQLSGMVSDADVVTAGRYLGADFVVVTKIQQVSGTYFISAKMIAVKTGVIANQTSAQGEGKLSALIDLAAEVGEVLSGGAVLAQSAAGGQRDISKPEAAAKPQPRPKAKRPPSPASGISVGAAILASSETWLMEGDWSSSSYYYEEDSVYAGLLACVELRYLSLGLGIGALGSGYWIDEGFYDYSGAGDYYGEGDITSKQLFLIICASAKYPLYFGSFSVYPIVGVEYDWNLSYTDEDGNDLKDYLSDTAKTMLDRLYVKGGAGLAYALTPALSLCAEALYAYKFKSDNDKGWDDWAVGAPFYYENYSNRTTKLELCLKVLRRL